METITNTLRDSKAARWTALAVVAFTMLCGYWLTDVMAPLKPMLEKELLWNSAEYGFFTSAYGWFNVFLGMLIIGGIILDKMGVRFTGKLSTIIMVVGTGLKYWPISTHVLDGKEILGMNSQAVIAGLGYAGYAAYNNSDVIREKISETTAVASGILNYVQDAAINGYQSGKAGLESLYNIGFNVSAPIQQ